MLTPTTNSLGKELRESVIFQPVLQAYPTQHPWIVTAHVSLGHLEHHWKPVIGTLLGHNNSSFPGPATISTDSTAINTASGTYKHRRHIQFLQNNHNICNQIITN